MVINSLPFVLNGEILNFRQTFLEDTLIFVKKCTLYRERGHMKMIIEILQLWGCHRLSKNLFSRIPAFWRKNVRCTVEGAHDAVNKNFTIEYVSICQKFVRCKVIGIKKFTENIHLIPHIFSEKCTLYCEREKIAVKIHKKFTKLHMVIRWKFVRLRYEGKYFCSISGQTCAEMSVIK